MIASEALTFDPDAPAVANGRSPRRLRTRDALGLVRTKALGVYGHVFDEFDPAERTFGRGADQGDFVRSWYSPRTSGPLGETRRADKGPANRRHRAAGAGSRSGRSSCRAPIHVAPPGGVQGEAADG